METDVGNAVVVMAVAAMVGSVVIPSNALLICQTSSFKLYEIKGPVTGTVNRSTEQ